MIFPINMQDNPTTLVKLIGFDKNENVVLGDYFSLGNSKVDIIYIYKGKALGQIKDVSGTILVSKKSMPFLKVSFLGKKINGYFAFANKGSNGLYWSRKGKNEEFFYKKYGSLIIDAGYGCKITGYDKDKLASWLIDCDFSTNENGFIDFDFFSWAKRMGLYSIVKNVRKFENQNWIKSSYDGKKFAILYKEKSDSNTKSMVSLMCKDFEHEFEEIGIQAKVFYFNPDNINVDIGNPYSIKEYAYFRD